MKITKVVIGCFIACMALLAGITHSYIFANTGRDISNDAVRSLHVSSQNILDGNKIRVDMTFDDQNGKIQGGDVIRINWKNTGDAYFAGYTKKFPLTVQGYQVGEANITTSGAILTFNDTVNNLHNVSGSVYFEMQGRNVTATLNEDIKSVFISAGTLHLDVNITKPTEGSKGVFYYKTGDMLVEDTDHVRWFLCINNNRSYVDGDIYIVDHIQGGQRLEDDSFVITVTGQKTGSYSGIEGIKAFENDFQGSQIIYRADDNEITVYIPKNVASLNNFSIMYKTKITNYEQKEFVNKTKAWYKEHGEAAVGGESFDFAVANIHAGAKITGTVRGELKIFKFVKGTKTPIEGVIFRIEKADGSEIENGKTSIDIKTKQDGIADVKNLPVGKYVVKEVSAPEWIAFDPLHVPTLEFEVKHTDVEGTTFEVENNMKTISIPVEKQWIGEKKEQAIVHLYANDKEIETIVLNEDNQWKSMFTNLPVYDVDTKQVITYTIREDAINGYETEIIGNVNEGFVVRNKQVVEGSKTDEEHHEQGKEEGMIEDTTTTDDTHKGNGSGAQSEQEQSKKEKEEIVKPQGKEENKQEVVKENKGKDMKQSVNTSDVQLTTLWISAAIISSMILLVLVYKRKINKA